MGHATETMPSRTMTMAMSVPTMPTVAVAAITHVAMGFTAPIPIHCEDLSDEVCNVTFVG